MFVDCSPCRSGRQDWTLIVTESEGSRTRIQGAWKGEGEGEEGGGLYFHGRGRFHVGRDLCLFEFRYSQKKSV